MPSKSQIVLFTLVWLAAGWSSVFASGGRPMAPTDASPRSSQDRALEAYNTGVKQVGQAKDDERDAAMASDRDDRDKALARAQKSYLSALGEFQKAVEHNPGLFQAWNYVGFCQRHLGRYEDALTAYGKALELEPRYGEAYEYRAEAYLGLNRLEDAKASYMQLFSMARPLADELMTAMHRWVEDRQQDSKGVSAQDLAAFARWLDERAAIAQQTTSLWLGPTKQTQLNWN